MNRYKKCTHCGEDKPLSGYYAHKATPDGLYPHCRSCHLAMSEAWRKKNMDKVRTAATARYRKNPEKYRKLRREYHSRNRKRANATGRKAAKKRWEDCVKGLGGKCSCCGERRMTMLEIDHIQGFGNQHRRKMGGAVGVYVDIIKQGFPKDKYRVLCCNCNQSRRRNRTGNCEHIDEIAISAIRLVLGK